MSWTQCENGHTYNTIEEPNGCPHCSKKEARKITIIHTPDPGKEPEGTSGIKGKDSKKTIVFVGGGSNSEESFDPVVGWMVCTKGKDVGKDFKVLSGWNGVGRDESMTICISSDETISRADHVKVLFDSQSLKFYLALGNSRNPVYLNKEVLKETVELSAYDVIELGSTQLTFIPFCSDKFNW